MFFALLKWSLIIGISIALFNGWVSKITGLDVGEHASEKLFSEFSLPVIFLIVVILAPVIEELLFRGPLILFRDNRYFAFYFYASALLFGAIHIANFESNEQVFWLAPLLVAPQIILGFFLGYIRIKLGLGYAMLLHAAHNAILLGPVLILELLNIPLE